MILKHKEQFTHFSAQLSTLYFSDEPQSGELLLLPSPAPPFLLTLSRWWTTKSGLQIVDDLLWYVGFRDWEWTGWMDWG